MLKGIGIILVGVSAFVGPSTANAQTGDQLVIVHMYSDASHSTEVGEIVPYCTANGIEYRLTGTYTNFQVEEPVDQGIGCFIG
ncbi:MAG: hypothetical protein JWO81_908 [Alphaproteobacteria bacterium]|nr:hypothetical protein [Alphaproteobacteria bacterium]